MKYNVKSEHIWYEFGGEDGEWYSWDCFIGHDNERTTLDTPEQEFSVDVYIPFNKDDPQESIDKIKKLVILK
jgi:hypothetical protein